MMVITDMQPLLLSRLEHHAKMQPKMEAGFAAQLFQIYT